MRSIVTYESQHGSAKRLAHAIASRLGCLCVNVDTPFQAEDETTYDSLILVFGFRGPYTAQLTKLFVGRMQGKLRFKHVIVVGEGLFSEKEFPGVARSLKELASPYSFHTFFMTGQLRVASLTQEEKALLGKFSELTGMEITDMGEYDPQVAKNIAEKIARTLDGLVVPEDPTSGPAKWICGVCGYVHTGETPPEKCPVCSEPSSAFRKRIWHKKVTFRKKP